MENEKFCFQKVSWKLLFFFNKLIFGGREWNANLDFQM